MTQTENFLIFFENNCVFIFFWPRRFLILLLQYFSGRYSAGE
jgi:hypothetical protein